MRKRAASRLAIGIAACGIAVASIAVAAPAEAAPNCTSVAYNLFSGAASASCSGVGQVRLRVACDAVVPLPSWTQYSTWFTMTGGTKTLTAQFPSCPPPAKASIRAQYLN